MPNRIIFKNNTLNVPNIIEIPYISGDGIGQEIWKASQPIFDEAIKKNHGSKLKTEVTGKVKKGSKAAKRRKSYCERSAGQLKKSSKKPRNNPNSRIRQARRRWKC